MNVMEQKRIEREQYEPVLFGTCYPFFILRLELKPVFLAYNFPPFMDTSLYEGFDAKLMSTVINDFKVPGRQFNQFESFTRFHSLR